MICRFHAFIKFHNLHDPLYLQVLQGLYDLHDLHNLLHLQSLQGLCDLHNSTRFHNLRHLHVLHNFTYPHFQAISDLA